MYLLNTFTDYYMNYYVPLGIYIKYFEFLSLITVFFKRVARGRRSPRRKLSQKKRKKGKRRKISQEVLLGD